MNDLSEIHMQPREHRSRIRMNGVREDPEVVEEYKRYVLDHEHDIGNGQAPQNTIDGQDGHFASRQHDYIQNVRNNAHDAHEEAQIAVYFTIG